MKTMSKKIMVLSIMLGLSGSLFAENSFTLPTQSQEYKNCVNGDKYDCGNLGVDAENAQDYPKAIYYYTLGCNFGDSGQCQDRNRIAKEQGVNLNDLNKAVQADEEQQCFDGNGKSCGRAAIKYIKMDYPKAKVFAKKGAELKDGTSIFILTFEEFQKMRTLPASQQNKKLKELMPTLEKACKYGHSDSCVLVGDHYRLTIKNPTAQDLVKISRYYNDACTLNRSSQGCELGQKYLMMALYKANQSR